MELKSLGTHYPLRAEIRRGWCVERMDSSLINFDLNVSYRECHPSSGGRVKCRSVGQYEVVVDGRGLPIGLDHNSHTYSSIAILHYCWKLPACIVGAISRPTRPVEGYLAVSPRR